MKPTEFVAKKYKAEKDADGKAILDFEVKVTIDFPENLSEAVSKYGEEKVFGAFEAGAGNAILAIMRQMKAQGKSEAEITAYLSTWKPGDKRDRTPVDPRVALKAKWADMTAEEKAAFIKELKSM